MGFFDKFNDATRTDNNKSPFGEAGLLGDPLHYAIGSKYDDFMRKTWEMPNKYAGQALTKFDTFDRKINPLHRAMDKTEIGGKIKDFVHNKPGDSALAILGTVFGGGALANSGAFGGMFGGSGGGGSDLGIFSNGGTGGIGTVGNGNAGAALPTAIQQGGGIGGTGGATGGGMTFGQFGKDFMKNGLGGGGGMPQLPGQQQQSQQPQRKPYLYRGQIIWL